MWLKLTFFLHGPFLCGFFGRMSWRKFCCTKIQIISFLSKNTQLTPVQGFCFPVLWTVLMWSATHLSHWPHKPHSSFSPVWVFMCIFMFLLFTLTSHPSKLHSIGAGLPSSACCTFNKLPINQGYWLQYFDIHLYVHGKIFDMFSTHRTGNFWSSRTMLCSHVLLQVQRWRKLLAAHIASPFNLLIQGWWTFYSLVVGAITEEE